MGNMLLLIKRHALFNSLKECSKFQIHQNVGLSVNASKIETWGNMHAHCLQNPSLIFKFAWLLSTCLRYIFKLTKMMRQILEYFGLLTFVLWQYCTNWTHLMSHIPPYTVLCELQEDAPDWAYLTDVWLVYLYYHSYRTYSYSGSTVQVGAVQCTWASCDLACWKMVHVFPDSLIQFLAGPVEDLWY